MTGATTQLDLETGTHPAERFYGAASGVPQMAHRGRIRSGADADFIVFGPNTVTGHSTMEKAGLPSSGISSVAVNGTVVVKKSMVLKDVTPGTPVRLLVVAEDTALVPAP